MGFKIGQMFLLKVKDGNDMYIIFEINKKKQQYILQCGSRGKNWGKKIRCDMAKFEATATPDLPIMKVKGEIVEDEDRIYIKAKENKVDDTLNIL